MEDRRTVHEPVSGRDDLIEKRAGSRITLLLRSAKLIGPCGEFLCVIRDVSESGAKLRLFHPVVGHEGLLLEVTAGEPLAVEKIWERGGEAGFRFVDPVDVRRFVTETGPFPKRAVRISLNHLVTLGFAGRVAMATIRDISREGARVETAQRLAIGQTLRLEGDRLPEFDAVVRWRRHPHYGLVFRQLMSMEELALRTHQLQLSKVDSVVSKLP